MDISIRELHYTYPTGVEALRGVSLDIPAGQRVAILGQNGSGKTTLVKHLNGLLRPARGDVLVGDWDTRTHTVAQLARRVGFLFQNPDEQIFKNVVAAEVAFGPRHLNLSEDEVQSRVASALQRAGLANVVGEHPYELLPSQRKWVAIASVLAMDPPVLVLDEPTTGQDARGLARLGALVRDLSGEGRTVVIVSHDVDFCAEHFERVVVMLQGQLIADGPARDILPQAELLAPSHVEPPQITRLALALGLTEPVTTVPEFLSAIR